MGLIEKIKGLLKPKLTFEQLAIAITSDVRIAIIEELGLVHGRNHEPIQRGVNAKLDREVSSKSLDWHLKKLTDSGILEEISISDYGTWSLTSSGREVFKVLEKVEREMEEAEG